MSGNDYIPSYKALNSCAVKHQPPKTLFMAPVYVKRENGTRKIQHGDCAPTRENPQLNHESYTQTSKTIIELAQIDKLNVRTRQKPTNKNLQLDLKAEKLKVSQCEDFDEKFSVDSLNLREEPEKENSTHHTKTTRELLEFLDMKDVNNVRLNQWVDDLNISPLIPRVSQHGRSKFSLAGREKDFNRQMTSFHSLIHLNDEAIEVRSGKNVEKRISKLGAWHSQTQYGVDDVDSTCTPNITSSSKEKFYTTSTCSDTKISRVSDECQAKSPQASKFSSTSMTDAIGSRYQCAIKNKDAHARGTFMSPTLSSESKSLKQQVESVRCLMGSKFREGADSLKLGRGEIPYARFTPGVMARAVKSEELAKRQQKIQKIPCAMSSSTLFGSSSSCDNGFFLLLNLIKSPDFNTSLKGLAEIIDMAKHMSRDFIMPYMTVINQRLLELLKSPRSHVARTACQLTGHFFEVMKDTRRPEFDDIINTLLYKTADASKFIRQDANMALDAMVTHIPIFHAVRSLCAKGPTHRNPLVRCAAVRLIICAVVIAGPAAVMNNPNLETTRKRIIENLGYFLDDKNVETRKYAERLYMILHKEGTFDFYAKKYLNRTKHDALIIAIKTLCKKSVI